MNRNQQPTKLGAALMPLAMFVIMAIIFGCVGVAIYFVCKLVMVVFAWNF